MRHCPRRSASPPRSRMRLAWQDAGDRSRVRSRRRASSAAGLRHRRDHRRALRRGDCRSERRLSSRSGRIAALPCLALYEEATAIPGGAVLRGPNRWYVAVQPERVDGFVEIARHPWLVAVSGAVLATDYKIVEFGFDIPFPGAADQPWHRDFPGDPEPASGHRLSSLAFNMTTVDTRQAHGPFEIALGTQWDGIPGAKDGMFPSREPMGSLPFARRAEAAPARRHFSAYRADHPSRHRELSRTNRGRC